MPTTVQLSSLLRDYVGGSDDLALEAQNVRALLGELERLHPKIYVAVCDETGAIRKHVNVFVNTLNIKVHAGLDTQLAPGDTVTILQAVSGG